MSKFAFGGEGGTAGLFSNFTTELPANVTVTECSRMFGITTLGTGGRTSIYSLNKNKNGLRNQIIYIVFFFRHSSFIYIYI